MASHRRRIKRLGYRDQQGLPQSAHQAHWSGFQAAAGDVIVAYIGDWGTVQFWAADEAEGRRVIAHACAIAGIPLTGASAGEWVITNATGGRNGKPGAFVVPVFDGVVMASKRSGPSGPVYL